MARSPASRSRSAPGSRRLPILARCSSRARSRISSPARGFVSTSAESTSSRAFLGPGGSMLLSMARDAYIVDAVRSPIGRRNGSLSEIRAEELAAQVMNGLVDRLDLEPGELEDVQMGCVTQIGEQALNVGRQAVLVAGWPETVCASTIDRQCGSSLQAAFNGASAIQAGHLDLVVAAGVEHMTRVPMGSNLGDAGWGAVNEKIGERWPIVPQGISAEVIAEEWGQTREELDAYSYESHRRAVAAIDEGQIRARDRAGRDRRGGCCRPLRRGRDAPSRHVYREACFASARLQERRGHHRWELELDRGRLGRDAPRERRSRRATRTHAARQVRVLRALRCRPVSDAAREPGSVRAGALEGGAHLGRHLRDRGQRGVRVGRAPVPGRQRACTSAGRVGTSTRTGAGSRSVTRWEPRVRGSPRRSSTSSTAAGLATGSPRCASARVRRSQASSNVSRSSVFDQCD